MILHVLEQGLSYVRSHTCKIFTLIFSNFQISSKFSQIFKAQLNCDQSCDNLTLFDLNMTLRKDSFEFIFNYIM